MATGPLDTGTPGVVGPWSWLPPPAWDVSGGVPPTDLQAPTDGFPPAAWAPGDEFATPMLPDPPLDDTARVSLDEIEIEPNTPDVHARVDGAPPAPPWAQQSIGRDELAAPSFPGPPGLTEPDPFAPPSGPADPLGPPADPDAVNVDVTEEELLDDQVKLFGDDPIALADFQSKHAKLVETTRATKMLEERERQLKELQDNIDRRTKAREIANVEMADVSARAKKMADSSPFDQFWESRETGQKITGYIAAFLGGLLQSTTGGRNPAIDFIMKMADDDAQNKWASLRERRGIAQGQLDQASEDFREREATRQASYTQIVGAFDAELALLDPQGTEAARIAEGRNEVLARQQASFAEAAQQRFENGIQQGEFDAMRARDAEAIRARRAASGAAAAARQDANRKDERDFKYRVGQDAAKAAADLAKQIAKQAAGGGDEGDAAVMRYKRDVQENDDSRFIGGGMFRGIKSAKGEPIANEEGLLLNAPNAKGEREVYRSPDPKVAEETARKLASAADVTNMISEILAIRDRVGGESAAFNSDDRQALDVLAANVKIRKRDGLQGMSSDSDMENIAAAAGAKSVASFRARAAGLKKGREVIANQFNTWMDSHQYTGDRIEFADVFKGRPASRDAQIETLSRKSPYEGINRSEEVGFLDLPSAKPDVIGTPARIEHTVGIARQTEGLAARAREGDELALQGLIELAAQAPDPNARRAARLVLAQLQDEGVAPGAAK